MSNVKWVKITTDIFDDEKILLIESLPEADSIIVIWFKLLCLAGKQNNNGVFVMNDKIPYTEKMLATIFRRKETTVQMALKTFQDFKMIEIIEGVITIPNWDKHQNIMGLDKIREDTRVRVALHREKQKQIAQCNVTGNVTVTQCNATEEEKNKKKNIEEEYNNICASAFSEFWDIYPRKIDKARAEKAFKGALKKDKAENIINGTKAYAKQCAISKTEQGYIKHAATFLNGECWKNEYNINETQEVKQKIGKYDNVL